MTIRQLTENRSTQYLLVLGAVVVIAAFVAFRLSGGIGSTRAVGLADSNKGPSGDTAQAIAVVAEEPSRRQMVETIEVTGTLESAREALVYNKEPGTIAEVLVEEGDVVEEGQLLATLEAEELELSLQQAEASYRQAVISLGNAEETYKRNKSMYRDNLISEQQWGDAKVGYESAVSARNEAKAALDLARLRVEHTRIVAPQAGTVVERAVEPTQRLAGMERVFRIADLNHLRVRVHLPESDIRRVQKGQTVQVRVDALARPSHPDEYPYTGAVDLVSPRVDPDTGTVEVRVVIEGADPKLTVGMFSRLRIVTAIRDNAFVIPKQALISTDGVMKVFTIRDDNTAALSEPLTLGIETDNYAEVLAGLDADTPVVIDGQNLLSTGDPVRRVTP